MGKKPFSGKQKKKQLQEKRKLKSGEGDHDHDKKNKQANQPKEPVLHHPQPRSNTRRSMAGGRNQNLKKLPPNLRTVFEVEDKEIIERRKEKARAPFERGCEEKLRVHDINLYSTLIDFPQRPPWATGMSTQEIEENERRYFNKWLRDVYARYDRSRLNFFEHNLEVWRQLWRVCEMSDVLAIVADIRHPLFHFPPSLYRYCVEVLHKPIILILNKIDLVGQERVEKWTKYFTENYPNLKIIPFSGHTRMDPLTNKEQFLKKNKKKKKKTSRYEGVRGGEKLIKSICELAFPESPDILSAEEMAKFEYIPTSERSKSQKGPAPLQLKPSNVFTKAEDSEEEEVEEAEEAEEDVEAPEEQEEHEEEEEDIDVAPEEEETDNRVKKKKKNKKRDDSESEKLEKDEETERYKKLLEEHDSHSDRKYRVIGMIGHPNVGKSSLINGMKQKKVVSTSRSPGHTKHFQTIFLTDKIVLCDCPGLVFPALDMARELQLLCGLYPIAQAREPYSAIRYLGERVRVEEVYALQPPPDDNPKGLSREDFPWSGWNLALAYAIKRSYYSKGGREDTYRAGLEILRDTLDGIVLLAFDPPSQPVPPPKIDTFMQKYLLAPDNDEDDNEGTPEDE